MARRPNADAWFISEAPSAWRVERDGPKEPRSFEDQWAISPGDHQFRLALAHAGFKTGEPIAPGGWKCYVTVLSKSSVDFATWRDLPLAVKMPLFRAWADVLRWELNNGSPRVLVAMDADTAKALRQLKREGSLRGFPTVVQVWSYGYLMRPSAERAQRVAEYRSQFLGVRRELDRTQKRVPEPRTDS